MTRCFVLFSWDFNNQCKTNKKENYDLPPFPGHELDWYPPNTDQQENKARDYGCEEAGD